jgi:GH25 family lysozyme M1 (1,4-beta-N-acetylmuramidase)
VLGTKTPLKRIVFWLSFIMAAVVGVTGFVAVVWMTRPQPEPEPSAETETTLEATLPAPEANPFGPEDFAWVDGRMTCLTAPALTGIDISSWQKEVDWQQVKEAGVEFVMIRFARRGTTEGGLYLDEYAMSHYAGAKAAGLKIGGYIFSQAVSVAEAEEEARYLLDAVAGLELEMPLVFDWELAQGEARTDDVDTRTVTDCAIAFCEQIKVAGYTPMIYFNESISRHRMYLEELTDYKFWLAKYSETMNYPYKVDMWQYSDSGTVPGIPKGVDMNLYFP